jgi:hypothetical protein
VDDAAAALAEALRQPGQPRQRAPVAQPFKVCKVGLHACALGGIEGRTGGLGQAEQVFPGFPGPSEGRYQSMDQQHDGTPGATGRWDPAK